MYVIIDLVNGEDIIVSEKVQNSEKKKEDFLKDIRKEKLVRKQVININGEIVSR